MRWLERKAVKDRPVWRDVGEQSKTTRDSQGKEARGK